VNGLFYTGCVALIDLHRSELVDDNLAAAFTPSLLFEEYRSRAIQLDKYRHSQQGGQKENQGAGRNEDVKQPFQL
jgi:hypothetical protein